MKKTKAVSHEKLTRRLQEHCAISLGPELLKRGHLDLAQDLISAITTLDQERYEKLSNKAKGGKALLYAVWLGPKIVKPEKRTPILIAALSRLIEEGSLSVQHYDQDTRCLITFDEVCYRWIVESGFEDLKGKETRKASDLSEKVSDLVSALDREDLPTLLKDPSFANQIDELQKRLLPKAKTLSPEDTTSEISGTLLDVQTALEALQPKEAFAFLKARLREQHKPVRRILQKYLLGLKGTELPSYSEKHRFATSLAELLTHLNLRVKCTKEECGEPAILRARRDRSSRRGVFAFEHSRSGKPTHHGGTVGVPALRLVNPPQDKRRK